MLMSRTQAPGRRLVLPLARAERPFLVAVALAVVVRVLVAVAFAPGFVFSDGPTYLLFADDLYPSPYRPVGYGVLLRFLALVSHSVEAVTVVHHVLGLVVALVLYALLRRWSVPPWLATLAVLPVLFDEMQLVLEHSVLSDVLFELLLVAAVAVLAWRPTPGLVAAGAGGLLLGAATLVRVVGEPGVLAGAVFCLLAAGPWSRRLLRAAVLVVCFVAPVTAYAAWYDHDNGAFALTQASGRALYMRTTTFVDCAKLDLPAYERALCPPQPVGHRYDPTDYGWHADETLPPLVLPPGVTTEQAYHDFAYRAIRAQPWDYVRTVVRDVALGFHLTRGDAYDYDTADKWSFHKYVANSWSDRSELAYQEHGGEQPEVRQPIAGWLDAYDEVGYLCGPLLLALLVVALAGLVVRVPEGSPASRPLIFLLVTLGMGLVVVPDVVAEFVWRYQLPAIVLIPPAAALGALRLRARFSRGRPPRRARTARTAA